MDLVQACTLCIDVNWNELVCARALIPSAAKFAPARTKCAHKSLPTYFRLELCAFVSLMMGIQHAPGECGTSTSRSTRELASILCVQFNDSVLVESVFPVVRRKQLWRVAQKIRGKKRNSNWATSFDDQDAQIDFYSAFSGDQNAPSIFFIANSRLQRDFVSHRTIFQLKKSSSRDRNTKSDRGYAINKLNTICCSLLTAEG